MEPNKSTKTKIVPGEKKVAPVQKVSECAADQDRNVVFSSMAMLGKIDDKYDMTASEILQIQEFYKQDIFGAICCAFRYGYLRGTEAAELPEDIKNIVDLLKGADMDTVSEVRQFVKIYAGRSL